MEYLFSKPTEIQKIVSERLLQNDAKDKKGVAHLVESHSVGLRHTAVNAQRDKLKKKKTSIGTKNGLQPANTLQPPDSLKGLETCMEFGKPCYPSWVDKLPPEWTVIQITVKQGF